MSKLFEVIILFSLLLSSGAYAISMGSVVKNDFEKITSSESAKFTLLFWNIDKESYRVRLDIRELPNDWIIIIEPNNFILNASVGKEYINLPYMNDGVKATPVEVIVKPITSTRPGKYNITLSSRTESPSDGISFSQERLFNFIVEVENPTYFESSEEQIANQYKENESTSSLSYKLNLENADLSYFYVMIIIIILLFSFLIYKYS
jgi:uncharacterized membrane protein